MLSLLLWILGGIGILCIIVFPGVRKGALPPDRETMISDAACNIASTAFILIQMLFPLYGYYFFRVRFFIYDPELIDGFGDEAKSIVSCIVMNFHEFFENKPEITVYAFLMLIHVFCFFAGMSLYKKGIKTGHKLFLLLPLLAFIGATCWYCLSHLKARFRIGIFFLYEILMQLDVFVRYLCGAFIMIAILYGIYMLLKKLLKNELIALIVILVLSFFAPDIRVIKDGVDIIEVGNIKWMLFGPGIPLFPIGMIVMKYKDKILPKTKKGIIIHLASWLCIGGISFYALSGLQSFLIKQAGLNPYDALKDIWYDGLGEKLNKLEKIYKVDSIPWLIFGLALSMLVLGLALLIRTGNPVTKFIREHCYLITVLLFTRHVFFEVSGWDMDIWTKTFGMPEEMRIILPFIFFVLSVVLAFLIKKFILDKRAAKMKT